MTGYYLDPLTRDASVLYLIAKHFPERVRKLSPRAMDNLAAPLVDNRYNTLSSAMTILALDAYAASSAGQLDQLAIDEVRAGAAPKDVSSIQANLVRSGTWSAGASRVDFVNGSSLPAWWITSQSGYDRGTSTKAIKNGLEIVRDYTDTDGKPLDKITVGREIDVHLKIRATGRRASATSRSSTCCRAASIRSSRRRPSPTRRRATATATAARRRRWPMHHGGRRSA